MPFLGKESMRKIPLFSHGASNLNLDNPKLMNQSMNKGEKLEASINTSFLSTHATNILYIFPFGFGAIPAQGTYRVPGIKPGVYTCMTNALSPVLSV